MLYGHATDISALEQVQKFAGRIVTKQWKSDYTTLLSTLRWQTLSSRRKCQKLKICYNILNGLSIIHPTAFTPHPRPSPRHPHSKPLFKPYVKTLGYKSSFFISVVPAWNSLPASIVNSPNSYSFKLRVRNHILN